MGFHHISVGDVIRNYMNNNPTNPDVIRYGKTLTDGNCIPAEESIIFLLKATDNIYQNSDKPVKLIIDGYPRSLSQFEAYNKHSWIPFNGNPNLFLIYVNTSEEIMKKRLHGRNRDYRDQDNIIINKRLQYFNTETMDVINTIKTEIPEQLIILNGDLNYKTNVSLLKDIFKNKKLL